MRNAGFVAGLVMLVAAGCNEYQLVGTEHLEVFQQEPSAAVDILFVVDDSPSMVHEHQKVIDAFGDFIGEATESDTDYHLGVTTTDMETNDGGILLGEPAFLTPESDGDIDALFMDKIHTVGTEGSGWEKGLQAAKRALFDSPAGVGDTANAGFLRDDADLAIIVVSDENDCSDEGQLPHQDQLECYEQEQLLVPVVDYIQAYLGLKQATERDVTLSAIVGPPGVQSCEDTVPGRRYLSAAGELRGVTGDICEPGFHTVMREAGLVSSGVLTAFELEAYPDETTLEVWVDNQPLDEDPDELDGWSYLLDDNAVHFWGDAVPPRGSTVKIHYWTNGS
jgi:hypothetical protein